MKAIVYESYGPPDVLELRETSRPTAGADDVVVKVHAAAANAGDWHLMRGEPFLVRMMFGGLRKPKLRVIGTDVAGRVEAVGSNVSGVKPGDPVFGELSTSGFGGYAEYVNVPARMVVPKPVNATFEEAAALPTAGIAALQGLRDAGRIRPGQNVLVNGASGGVGTFAVQIAKSYDTEVTAVCSARNGELVSSMGADHVIDYTREDFTRSGPQYDLILDAAAYRPIGESRRALKPDGTYVMVGGAVARTFQAMFLGPLTSLTGKRKVRFLISKPNRDDMVVLKDLVEAGNVSPVIDRHYPLADVPDAIRYLETKHARGKVVIVM